MKWNMIAQKMNKQNLYNHGFLSAILVTIYDIIIMNICISISM